MELKIGTKTPWIVIAVLSFFLAGQAVAAPILVWDSGRPGDASGIQSTLNGLGFTTNLTTSLPADLSPYDAVWNVNAFDPLSAGEQTQLQSFLGSGGGVHLTGERPCCEALNDSLQNLLRNLTGNSGLVVGDQGDIPGPYAFQTSLDGPNALSSWVPSAPGGIAGINPSNVLVTGAGGTAVGGFWREADLGGGGRVTLLMDVNWMSNTNQSNTDAAENIATFLTGAGGINRVPAPGALSLIGLGLVGLYVGRRRQQPADS